MILLEVVFYAAVLVVSSLTTIYAFRLYRAAPHYIRRSMSYLVIALVALSLGVIGLASMRISGLYGGGAAALPEAVALVGMMVSMSFFLVVSMNVKDGKL